MITDTIRNKVRVLAATGVLFDTEIARALGISKSTVGRIRRAA
jgi:DNA invertase Pin-like site-specific DNA recombinase